MRASSGKYLKLYLLLTEAIKVFLKEVDRHNLSEMATEEWTVKDELCHIVFWHENYAANYKALAEKKEPPLPDGMSTINMAGVMSLRKYSIKELVKRLYDANKSLHKSIVVKKVPRMTYSQGGRVFETPDFLEMITRHIQRHTIQVRRAKKAPK